MELKNSKKYLNKKAKLLELILKETVKRTAEFNDILENLDVLQSYMRSLEDKTKQEVKFDDFYEKTRTFRINLDSLSRFQVKIAKELTAVNTQLSNKGYQDKDMTTEELENLAEKTKTFSHEFIETLNSLAVIKTAVDKTYESSSCYLNNNRDEQSNIFECMMGINRNSNEAKIKIEQLADTVSLNAKKGNLHDISVADSLLKADIKLLKKQGTSR